MTSSLFLCFVLSSFNFIFNYISLEALTLTSIIMIAITGSNSFILESLLNYFFISAISSVFFIIGISIIFLYSLPLNFHNFRESFDLKLHLLDYNILYSDYLLILGIFCILVFFLIKIGLFPFFFWLPKFYNSISFILFYFLIIIKFAFVLNFFRLINYLCIPWENIFLPVFYICSLGSIIVGCIGAICANNLKYFLTFTSINNLGYVFMGFSTTSYMGWYYSFFFLIVYFLNFIIFFISIIFIKEFDNNNFNIIKNDISFLKLSSIIKYNKNVWLNILLLISFFSISGLPPFASFILKINLLNEVWLFGNFFLVFISLVASFISIFYYFKLVKCLLINRNIK